MMYPAWLVPIGYVALLIAIWIFHDNWEKIKQFKIFDYTLLVGAVLFAMSMVAYYMKINAEYITAITGTVYPGQRMETGSFVLPDVFNYFQSFMYGFKDIGNASENSSFLCFFPIPLIAAGYQWIKDKRKDWFLSGMLSISIIFIIYCTIGFPESVSKITLFSYCPPTRIIPVLGLVEIYLLIRCLGIRKKEQKSFPVGASLLIGVITASLGWFYSEQKFSGYLLTGWAILAAAVIILVSVSVLAFRSSRQIMILEMFLVGVSVIVAFSIRPVSIGLDAIYSKPAAAKIQEICSEDETAKWLVCSDDFRTSGFVVACGASTLNSVNTYPNMELWEKLDIEHQYERVYNRYAHISVELVDEKTSFKLLHEDAFRLNLSYDDLDRIGCDYLFATKYLDGNSDDVILKIIYEENGCIIYKVVHKKSA